MEILKNFGFDPVMLVAQIINFLIILFLLKRFMYKPVLEMLKKRQDSIAEGLKQNEEARITLEKAILQEKKILENAKSEAQLIVEDAKTRSLQVSKEIEESAKKQAENIILQTREQLRLESLEIEKHLIENITLLAQNMLKKGLEGVFTQGQQKEITQKVLKQIKKIN